MKYLIMLVLTLTGCCAFEGTISTTTHRDSAIVFQQPPLRIDTVFIGHTYLPSPCDTAAILNLLGGFEIEGTSPDSSTYYKAKWDALDRRLRLGTTHKPIVKIVRVDDSNVSTYIQKTPLLHILGYIAIGMFVMVGIVIAVKGFL